MKRVLTILLMLCLAAALAVPASAADSSRSYDLSLTVNGEHEVRASTGDILTVTLTLRRTDTGTDDLMHAMQDEICYDDSFFEIVDSSIMVKAGIETTDIALQSGGRALYMNFLSLSGGEIWESEALICSFGLKVLGVSGASTLKNMNYRVSLADGSGSYAVLAHDLTVVVSTDCTVRFETDGGSEVADLTVFRGDRLPKPADPTREGYVFRGWYTNPDKSARWDFDNDTVNENKTLYAGWEAVSATETDDGGQGNGEFEWWIPLILILTALLILTAFLVFGKKKKAAPVSSGGTET